MQAAQTVTLGSSFTGNPRAVTFNDPDRGVADDRRFADLPKVAVFKVAVIEAVHKEV